MTEMLLRVLLAAAAKVRRKILENLVCLYCATGDLFSSSRCSLIWSRRLEVSTERISRTAVIQPNDLPQAMTPSGSISLLSQACWRLFECTVQCSTAARQR